MSKAFAGIKQGLQEAVAHQQGRQAGVKLHVPPQVDVKEVRRLTGLTRVEFAARFAISLGTLRHWERGDRTPRGTALVLLNIIAKEPMTVLRALKRPDYPRAGRPGTIAVAPSPAIENLNHSDPNDPGARARSPSHAGCATTACSAPASR